MSESVVDVINTIRAHQCVVFNHCELAFTVQSSLLCCEAKDALEQFPPRCYRCFSTLKVVLKSGETSSVAPLLTIGSNSYQRELTD